MKFKNVISNCLDDKTKTNNKLNKNYFFVSTILFITLNILIFAIFKSDLAIKYKVGKQSWDSILNFKGLFSAIINNISHWNWEHVLLNMLTFVIISIYFERKFGSLKYFLLTILLIVVSAAFVSGNHQSLNYAGWSCVNFALKGFFIISYFFSLGKHKNTNGNYIYGTITFISIFVSMWWKIWTFEGVSASAADLTHNMGHYSGFIAGLIIGLTIYLIKLFTHESQMNPCDAQSYMVNKKIKIVCILISICLCIASIVLACTIK